MISQESKCTPRPVAHHEEARSMIRRQRLSRRAFLPLALVFGLALAAPALADSVSAEQTQGAQVLAQVQHGKLNSKSLTDEQFQNLGEYLMGQLLGSTQRHQRMNTLMDEMMGPSASDEMHVYLGKRYLGVTPTPSSRDTQLYGLMGVMMSGYHGSALAGMMGAYLNGQGTAGYGTGAGMMGAGHTPTASSGGGWPTGAVVAVVAFGAVLIVGLGALAVPRIRKRRHSGTTVTA
jgi:hypothetical protein